MNYTTDIVKQEISKLTNGKYELVSEYVNYKTPITILHKECSTQYETSWGNFKRGRRCPNKKCLSKRKHKCNPLRKTTAEFLREVQSLVGDEYTILSEYYNWETKVAFRHNDCGNIFYMIPNSFLRGQRCPKCRHQTELNKRTKSDAQFKKELLDKFKGEYDSLEKYQNNATKILFRHNTCGYVWKTCPANLMFGYGCPNCRASHGEVWIKRYLESIKESYIYQYRFPDLKDRHTLSYDFYLPDKNTLIEYQGIQHYEPDDWYGGPEAFKRQQKHDQLKKDYAKSKGINLICIPYTYNSLSKVSHILKEQLTA